MAFNSDVLFLWLALDCKAAYYWLCAIAFHSVVLFFCWLALDCRVAYFWPCAVAFNSDVLLGVSVGL